VLQKVLTGEWKKKAGAEFRRERREGNPSKNYKSQQGHKKERQVAFLKDGDWICLVIA
jgi:hypothetical protein